MPTYSILDGRDPLVVVDLAPGESIVAESNALVMSDPGISVEGRMQGGLLSSLARNIFNGESFFLQVLSADKGRTGQAFLGPLLPGDVKVIEIGPEQFFLNSGAFLASDSGVKTSSAMNSSVLGAFFGGTGGFVVMRTEGKGQLCLSAFGQILEINVSEGEDVMVDNGHVVAWSTNLNYTVQTASSRSGLLGRAVSTAMSGEMLVTRFSGNGKLYICSRNPVAFQQFIGSHAKR